jgi:hypothetical protein
MVTESTEDGATLLAGGTFENLFYRPTLLSNVATSSIVYREEVFGPVAPVIAYGSDEEAVTHSRVRHRTNFPWESCPATGCTHSNCQVEFLRERFTLTIRPWAMRPSSPLAAPVPRAMGQGLAE